MKRSRYRAPLKLFQKIFRNFYDFIKFILYNQYIIIHNRESFNFFQGALEGYYLSLGKSPDDRKLK